NGTGDNLFVKRPKVLQRTAASRQDHDIGEFLVAEISYGRDDFTGRALSLHTHGIENQMHIGEAAAQNPHYIPNGGAARGRYQADASRQHRERLLVVGREQAFRLETLLQLVKGKLQGSQADGLEMFDVDLILAAGFIHSDRTSHGDMKAVFRAKLQARKLHA